ncbi:MAG: sigma-70 family RNA polymerase sigma factor [Bacteroidia bacterium]|nr:sigma-70 family RNA polymerase sigma factor [Bacteroidia bacterium]
MEWLKSLDDLTLVALYRKEQDMLVISVLMDRYQARCTAMTARFIKDKEDVHDFVMETYITLSQKLLTHEITTNFGAWLMIMVKRKLLDRDRGEDIIRAYLEWLRHQDPSYELKPEQAIDRELLHKAINSLEDHERRFVQLFYFEEKTYSEIKALENLTFNQVRGLGDRVRKKLREILKHLMGRMD